MTDDDPMPHEEDAFVDLSHLPVDRRLRCLVGDPLPVRERRLWLAMSKGQRELAMHRLKAIVRWEANLGPRRPADAATRAGLATNHFYEMTAAWRRTRSIASVEALAAAPRARSSEHERALRRHVKSAFDELPEGAAVVVTQVAERLGVLAAGDLDAMPSHATLRRRVQEEQRRRERNGRPGGHLQFDCCAFSMSTMDHGQRVLLAIVDRRTQLVLGAALGAAEAARRGYGHAARDALRRIETGSLRGLAWADRLIQAEMVTGADAGLSHIGVEAVRAGLPAMQPAARSGRYLRQAAGDRMGRVLFLSGDRMATSTPASLADMAGTSDDAARLQVEVEVHNAAILAGLERGDAGGPPPGLVATLAYIARFVDAGGTEQEERA